MFSKQKKNCTIYLKKYLTLYGKKAILKTKL